jgi:uncharacterized membrane-anchored protein
MSGPLPFAEHGMRRHVVGEMHLRRFPAITASTQIIQLVRLVDPTDRIAERAAVLTLPGIAMIDGARHAVGSWPGDIYTSWERHSEASTLTLILTGDAAAPLGWTDPGHGDVENALEWAHAMPGGVIRATRLLIAADDDQAAPLVASAGFRRSHLVSCLVAGGVRIWSDFRIHQDGYGRLVIAANGLLPEDLGRCVQRLQELGNYRNLALLGLPVAQQSWLQLDGIGDALETIGQSLTGAEGRDDELLAALTDQSARLLTIAAHSDYRMSATAAYAVIVDDRLRELAVRPIPGFPSLGDFIGRRFHPATRTCAALSRRLARLNGRAGQFTALLRARIETHIENQNAHLLRSMDRSARLQLQLQHLVEGLSVVAISYYLLGLLAYPVKAAEKFAHALSATLLLGLAAPIITILVFFALRSLRRYVVNEDDKTAAPRA